MKKRKMLGVTLIEILLVLVIISAVIYLAIGYLQQRTLQMRTDRASIQMQQILSAGLAYYVANGNWPSSRACLQASGGSGCSQRYLPNNLNSPWGSTYEVKNNNALFFVYTPVTGTTAASALAQASIIAGKLPLSYTTANIGGGSVPQQDACTGTTCYVVTAVNVPAQNLNNATAVNFAGVYHHGGCVPVPKCPKDSNGNQLRAQVYIVPLSVSGVNGNNTTAYPLLSFTGYAKGGIDASPGACDYSPGNVSPYGPCGDLVNGVSGTNYWRACLDVITTNGRLAQSGNTTWGSAVSLGAFTRCAPVNEQAGSNFNVFSR